MTDQGPRDVEWPTRRWLLWGVVAVVALIAVVLFFVNLGSEVPEPEELPAADQFEWSVVLTDLNGDLVTLKGDKPLGYPTETWQGDYQIVRSVGGTFEWDTDRELPVAVVEIDEAASCAALNEKLDVWALAAQGSQGDAEWFETRAFVQHALDVMRSTGCEVNIDVLNQLAVPP